MEKSSYPQENLAAKLLLVEDNIVSMTIMSRVLERAGYDVIKATDGEMALTVIAREQPALVLLDVILPGIDGYAVCRAIKQNPETAEIPVIFMTTISETENIVAAFEMGAVDYITKPIRSMEALARIRTHLTLRDLQLRQRAQIREHEMLIADLEAFTHMVAHDLKGPIANVVAFADLIRNDRNVLAGDHLDELVDMLMQTGYKMNDIIESLLVLAGVRLKDVVLVPVDMEKVVEESLYRLTRQIDMLGAEIILPETWPTAIGVPAWIEEVWVNYISNGLKYGGRPPVLELGVSTLPDNRLKFWVKDNGAGIPADQQKLLFQPFERLQQTRISGHGLGLSIVKRIVNKLSGTVGVESKVKRGSSFYFTLLTADCIPSLMPEIVTAV